MNTDKRSNAGKGLLATASVLALAAMVPSQVFAQEAANVGEVVVTASRVQSAGFTAPTPTTVLGTAELSRRAAANVGEAIFELPQVRPNFQASSGAATGANANAGAVTINMRGLNANDANRTLVLINGHRMGATSDLRQFPGILVSRADVVTGGASAAYGSDAVSGVVNFVFDTKFTGLKGQIQGGVTKYGDNRQGAASVMWGSDLFGDRAHIVVAAEYSTQSGAHTDSEDIRKDQRPWFAANRFTNQGNSCAYNAPVSTTCPFGGNGLPQLISADDLGHSTQMNPNGVIINTAANPAALRGITFEDGGIPRPFVYGVFLGTSQIGGDGTYPAILNIAPIEDHYALYNRLDFKINPKTNLWLEYANSYNHNQVNTARPRDQGNLIIRRENAFMPTSIFNTMVATNATQITMGRFNNDGTPPQSHVYNNVFRYAAGLDGELFGNWTWDAYAQYGKNHNYNRYEGVRNTAAWNFALDSIKNAQGVAVCRAVTLNNPTAAGCVPFNIFGPNAASQAARDYVFGTASDNRDTGQYNAQFNIHGEPLNTWAGPVAVAAGLEYRKETSKVWADPLANRGGWDSGNTRDIAGGFNTKEAYAEVAIPLAKDQTLFQSLDVNGAFRYTDYSSIKKPVSTWKVGATWKPVEELLLRGTYSKDVRAPNINELFAPANTSNSNVIQFQGPRAGLSTLTPFTSGGNPNLTEETSKTFSVGASFQPKFTRLRFSADYYNINISNQIGTVSAQGVIDLCKLNLANACSLLTFDSQGTVIGGIQTNVNNNGFEVKGIDFELSHVQPLSEIWSVLPGTLTSRALATRTLEFASITLAGRDDKVGQNPAGVIAGDPPSYPFWLATFSVSYNVGKFTGGISARHVSAGVVHTNSITGTATTRLNNNVHPQTLYHLNATYNLIDNEGRKLQLYGVINNLFNKGPPFPIYPAQGNWATFYETLGMTMRAGIRFQY